VCSRDGEESEGRGEREIADEGEGGMRVGEKGDGLEGSCEMGKSVMFEGCS
jgi:hypothetical protein